MSNFLKLIQPTLPVQFEFTLAEVEKLMQMQDQLNTYIHPEWKTQGFDWSLAIVDECMEIHGHLGWKWWKPDYNVGVTETNLKQVQLEVIDILHFALSQGLVEGFNVLAVSKAFNTPVYSLADLGYSVSTMAKVALSERLSTRMFWAILAHTVGLTKQQILETYVQKFVLNKFRQDHGYKTGEYQKIWKVWSKIWETEVSGEDNYWLEQVVNDLRLTCQDTTDENALYMRLEQLYNSRLNK